MSIEKGPRFNPEEEKVRIYNELNRLVREVPENYGSYNFVHKLTDVITSINILAEEEFSEQEKQKIDQVTTKFTLRGKDQPEMSPEETKRNLYNLIDTLNSILEKNEN